MYALRVSGAVNTRGCVWKFTCVMYKLSLMDSFIQKSDTERGPECSYRMNTTGVN